MPQIQDTPESREAMIEVADGLMGTNKSLHTALQEKFGEGDITLFENDLLEVLDEHALECVECGYWSETGFISDEGLCEDCAPLHWS